MLEDLSSVLRTQVRKSGVVKGIYNSNTGEVKINRSLKLADPQPS